MKKKDSPSPRPPGRFKSWRGEYTLIGLIILGLGLGSYLLDLPLKVASLRDKFFPKEPTLHLRNVTEFQSTFSESWGCFDTEKGHCGVDWDGLFQVSNTNDKPVTITDLYVNWKPSHMVEDAPTLTRLDRGAPTAEVFSSEAEFFKIFSAKAKDARIEQRWGRRETLPITLGPRQKRHAVFHVTYSLIRNGSALYAKDKGALYLYAAAAAGLPIDADGKYWCRVVPAEVMVNTTDGVQQIAVPILVMVPGCSVDLSSTLDLVKAMNKQEGQEAESP